METVHIRQRAGAHDRRTRFSLGLNSTESAKTLCGAPLGSRDVTRDMARHHIRAFRPIIDHPQCDAFSREFDVALCRDCEAKLDRSTSRRMDPAEQEHCERGTDITGCDI